MMSDTNVLFIAYPFWLAEHSKTLCFVRAARHARSTPTDVGHALITISRCCAKSAVHGSREKMARDSDAHERNAPVEGAHARAVASRQPLAPKQRLTTSVIAPSSRPAPCIRTA